MDGRYFIDWGETMDNKKYIIGVCLTNIYLEHERNFLKALQSFMKLYPVKIIVFQCYYDRIKNEGRKSTAFSVFKAINYDMLDAIVVNSYSLSNLEIARDIAQKARAHKVPVISIDSLLSDCADVVITSDMAECFRQIVKHMIEYHGLKNVFYMSGGKGHPVSELREKIFREVMAENNLEVTDDMIGYTDFWRDKTREVLENRFGHGEELPEAFICASDVLARETCDFVFRIGKSVPQDVLVSGYDAFDTSGFFMPMLTTAGLDYEGYARTVIETAISMADKENVSKRIEIPVSLQCNETCGCRVVPTARKALTNTVLFRKYTDRSHEDKVMFGIYNIDFESSDIYQMREQLMKIMINSSAIIVNDDFFMDDDENASNHTKDNPFTQNMLIICGKDRDGNPIPPQEIALSDLVPFDVRRVNDTGKITIVTPIIYKDSVYGYYLCDLDDFEDETYNLQNFSRTLNLFIGLRDKSISAKSLTKKVSKGMKVDPQTGFYNVMGLKEQFDKLYEDDPGRMRYKLVVSLYTLATWQYIFQNFGIEEANMVSKNVAKNLEAANPKNAIIGRISNENYIIINYMDPSENEGDVVNNATSVFYSLNDKYNENTGKGYYAEVNAGCTVVSPGFKGTLSDLIKIANNEMLVNRLRYANPEERKKAKNSLEKEQKFIRLVDNNMFFYCFQPIVEASTGEIYAYEALMRSPQEIGLSPIEILDIADELGRLYDIEKATIFNILSTYTSRIEMFGDRKIFINSIPGQTLKTKDFNRLMERYKSVSHNIVIEITEQNARSDEEMERFMEMISAFNSQFAVDDYGSGNSNIVNLLKFSPNVIKIDRYLVENINENVNKQMFVKNIIEFARKNNIKVIAEGVETKDELDTVIKFGVNLIQGYYTAKPKPEPVVEIAPEIKQNIIEQSRLYNVCNV